MKPKNFFKKKSEAFNFIDEIHRQSANFIEIAKEYFISCLLKRQLKILIELGPNDTVYSSLLKNKFVANFNKKSSHLFSQKISFMLLHFMINSNFANFSVESFKVERSNGLNRNEKSEKELIEPLVFEKIIKDEKNEKSEMKKSDSENRQLYDFFYLLLDGCVKIWEVFITFFF